MAELKLGKLPNRSRAKITLDLSPELDDQLRLYAGLHSQEHGEQVSAADLAPYMLAEFLAGDREFQKALRSKSAGG
ncbi:DUF2274 domain-containing protein [Caulobacter sp. 602-2]|uniref:DUF2274 domain-containing protein n=1 Tax=Caulobacter sp. 602-2 TaxID=2710887 RepID=A0A6G4QUQ7_9CAUL|nr:DUF2274 domain-containing protein [Caulobacter sp. 602-2]NGM49281.1 DUF2274 domain-containing protein [Caulobacter sp. 602-2]